MKNTFSGAGIVGLALALACHVMPVQALEIMVANNAPYTIDDKDHSGFFLDVVKKMLTAMKLEVPVTFMGWKDVQAAAMAGHDIVFFPYSRTVEREPNYMWVQKFWDIDEVFASKAGTAAIDSYEEGKALPAVGVVSGSTGHAELTKRGFDNIKLFSNAVAVVEAVASGTVAAAYSADIEMKYAWRLGKYPGDLVIGKTLAKRALYIAASKNSPEIKQSEWAQAFNLVQQDGTLKRAYEYYFGAK
jgi:ABC-type amino acid transport substrate-binding protein